MKTSDFDFDLPQDLIAQQAAEPRDAARLLRVTPAATAHHHVRDLPDLLRAGDVLVMNDTRVIPARLYGWRGAVKVEILLHKKQGLSSWLAFARPGKRLRVGDTVIFGNDFAAEIVEKHEGGEILLRFNVEDTAVVPFLHRYGEPPLPPYIKRDAGTARSDVSRYQTIYAARDGAVAAPTAGLHFTPDLLQRLSAKGVERVTVTLHVGAGTFLPVKVDNIADHVMHSEYGEISPEAAGAINKAKREGRRIIAVGTTSLRVIESAADENGVVYPFAAETAIFITPGYKFRAIDALMTNFHLPQSTLFMLVSAFMGLDRMRAVYACAIKEKYRFYSYGDTSLLERS
ncbi:MAG: tRNA preQ1(34) S-adenosylmethionine ribosyltransferase-isomerase QueA [Alphaproteobacteria bacterium]|nr:tRNA preQ1(34) S-adenosylmethionine ribosyltransferase-isomerase QueA [Alphaproteobacteria bacterium]